MLSFDPGQVIFLCMVCVAAVWWLARRLERSTWYAVIGLLPAAFYFPSAGQAIYGLGAIAIFLIAFGVLRLLTPRRKRKG